MTNVQKDEIRQAINNYCTAKGLSKNEFATQAGVSGATLSKIQNGKWEDIATAIWRKLLNKVRTYVAQVLQTADFAATVKLCNAARKNHFMIGLLADTGMGKTTSLTACANSKSTFYVAFDKTMRPKQFFAALLKEMGIAFEGNIHAMVNKVADELNEMESPLIMIDEAGKLTHTMILYLHVLRDKTIKNCGIVLAGMPYFKANLSKLSTKQKEGYAEFYRRVNLWHELEGLSRDEINQICKAYGITGDEDLREFRNKRRFGDLMNAIILHQTINE
jgi:DNA transposition AAA+ family ATPase